LFFESLIFFFRKKQILNLREFSKFWMMSNVL